MREVIYRRYFRVLKDNLEKPDLIISTHPFATQMCAYLKKKEKIDCKLATILTDYHIHPQWLVLSQYVNYFFVSNDTMKIDMIKEGKTY